MKRSDIEREIWLTYFNRTLLEKGIITKEEYHSMRSLIWKRTNTKTKTEA